MTLALATVLAGCGDDPAPPSPGGGSTPPPGPGPTPPQPIPPREGPLEIALLKDFELQGCSGLSIAQPTNRSAVQALLPDGFRAAALPDPITGEPSQFGVLIVDVYNCDNFTIPTAALPNTWFGHVYTLVEFPGDAVPGAADHGGIHEYLFRVLAGNDTLAILWPAAGYNLHNGSAQATLTGPLAAAGLPDALLPATAALGEYQFEATLAGAPDDQGEQTFTRYTRLADNSTLIWTGSQQLPVTHTGPGEVTLAPDDPFAGLGLIAADRLSGTTVLVNGGAYSGQQLVRLIPAP